MSQVSKNFDEQYFTDSDLYTTISLNLTTYSAYNVYASTSPTGITALENLIASIDTENIFFQYPLSFFVPKDFYYYVETTGEVKPYYYWSEQEINSLNMEQFNTSFVSFASALIFLISFWFIFNAFKKR